MIQALLDALEARLTGLTTSGPRVFVDRPEEHELQESEVPGLRIYDESSDAADEGYAASGAQVFRDQLSLRTECVSKVGSGGSEQTRLMQAEVLAALATPLTVADAQVLLLYRGYDHSSSGEGDRTVVVRRLRFEATIFVAADAPNAPA